MTDTVISNEGSGTGGGIVINPQSGGSAQVNLERVTVNGNAFGIAADGTNSTAGINMTIADSMIGGNSQDGIIAVTPSGGAPIGVMVTNTKSVNNTFGIRSIGPNVTVRVKNSDIMGNGTGLSFSGGGALLTYGNQCRECQRRGRCVLRAGRRCNSEPNMVREAAFGRLFLCVTCIRHFRLWHISDIARCPTLVRCGHQSGRHRPL